MARRAVRAKIAAPSGCLWVRRSALRPGYGGQAGEGDGGQGDGCAKREARAPHSSGAAMMTTS